MHQHLVADERRALQLERFEQLERLKLVHVLERLRVPIAERRTAMLDKQRQRLVEFALVLQQPPHKVHQGERVGCRSPSVARLTSSASRHSGSA